MPHEDEMDGAMSDHADVQNLREQIELHSREIKRLQGTTLHYRSWAAQLQARYQMFSPDAARPAKRVYIGNLPPEINENDLRLAINDLMVQIGGASTEGASVTSCKLYPGAPRGSGTYASGSTRSSSPDRLTNSPPHASPRSSEHLADGAGSSSSGSLQPQHPHQPPSSPNPSYNFNYNYNYNYNFNHPHPLHHHHHPRSPATGAPLPVVMPPPRYAPNNAGYHQHAPFSSFPQDKSYAFVEFRTVEEASNCMALDGVRFRDTFLKVRRPNNYDASVAIMLGPVEPNPALELSSLDIVRTVVQDSPNKVFMGGLPCDWTEEQVTEMLVPFGTLKAFNLVMDRATGNSRGYAFCEFADVAVTDAVIQNLNGKPVGNKYLTVKRALGPGPY